MKDRIAVVLIGALLQTVLWLGVLQIDPFGMSSAADRASESIFLKLYSYVYPSLSSAAARHQIVVVLLDEADLPKGSDDKRPKVEWPIPRTTYGQLLHKILEMKPKSVFLDILFDTNAGGNGGRPLLDAIPRGSPPVIFASYARCWRNCSQAPKLVPSLQSLPTIRAGQPPPESRSYRAVVQVNALPSHYPLYDNTGGIPHANAFTPAAALYDRLRPSPSDRNRWSPPDEMLIAWGSTLPASFRQSSNQFPAKCTKVFDDWPGRFYGFGRAVLIGMFNQWFSDPNADGEWNKLQPCEYHTNISANLFFKPLNADMEGALRRLVYGSYIFIGTKVAGTGDRVVSPVSGTVPGVEAHAMAFDNLLEFQGAPIRVSQTLASLIQAVLIFIALVAGEFLFAGAPHPETRGDALGKLLTRIGTWLGFGLATAVILLFLLMVFRLAPYNWGGVFSVAGAAFLPGVERQILILLIGKRQSMEV